MGNSANRFDQRLYELKLLGLSRKMQAESLASDRATSRETGTSLLKTVDGQLMVLRKWLEGVDQICRDVWQTQGEAITPNFVRGTLVPKASELIAARVGTIKSNLELKVRRGAVQPGNQDVYSANHHLAMEIRKLQGEVANRYEIEARELEHKNVLAARAELGSIHALIEDTRRLPKELCGPQACSVSQALPPPRPIGSQSDLWRHFGSEFEQLAREEERIERAGPKDRLLRAYCDYKKHPEVWAEKGKPGQGPFCLLKPPETGLWIVSDGVSENFQARFRTLAARVGIALGCPNAGDAEDFWLHWLYLDLLENKSDQLFAASKEGGMISRVCVASSTFCSRLERQALEQSGPGKQQTPPSQPTERAAAEATGGRLRFDQGENLRNAILRKKARIVEIERVLDRPPLTEYRGQPVHGGQNSRLRLEEERQHLLIAVPELERELQHLNQAGVSKGSSMPTNGEEFTHSGDYRPINVRGQNFTLTPRQAQVIQILDENRRNGLPEVGKDYLLEQLETPSSRLRDSFKSNLLAWKALVKQGTKKGTIRLNV